MTDVSFDGLKVSLRTFIVDLETTLLADQRGEEWARYHREATAALARLDEPGEAPDFQWGLSQFQLVSRGNEWVLQEFTRQTPQRLRQSASGLFEPGRAGAK